MRFARASLALVVGALLSGGAALAQQTQPRSRAQERTLAQLPKSLYFVLPPAKPAGNKEPARLLLVLPGGDGSREFLPFVENGIAPQTPDGCAVALLTAVKWRPDQEIVWPTAAQPVPDMGFATEQFVRAVTEELRREFHVDAANCAVLAWSSSGPAMHALLAANDAPFARGYLAMSVWPSGLDLAAVKGRRYLLEQSPDDQVTTFANVRAAYAALTGAGAIVRLSTYAGGHGWQDDPLPRLRAGLAWLFGDAPAPKPVWPPPKLAVRGGKAVNQLQNGGFEQGLDGWRTLDNSGTLRAEVDKRSKVEGRQALHLVKIKPAPFDLLVQEAELAAGKTVTATLRLQCKGASNVWVKVRLFDDKGAVVNDDVDVVHVTSDTRWSNFDKQWPANGAVRVEVQVLLASAGEVWIDDVAVTVKP